MVNLLLTGHRGFIGRHILQKAIESWRVKVLVVPKAINIAGNDWPTSFDNKIDTVIHCAALSTVNGHKSNKLFQVNVNGTRNVLKTSLKTNPKLHFIFLSSATVYAPSNDIRDEDSVLGPISDYGKSKLEAERWLIEYQKKHGFRLTILRPVAVVGRYMTHGLIKAVVDKLNSGQKPVQLLGTEETQSVKQFLHVNDLIYTIEKLMNNDDTRMIYNVVPKGEPVSVSEAFEMITNAFAINATMKFVSPTWKGDDTFVHMQSILGPGTMDSPTAIKKAALEYAYHKYLERLMLQQ